MESIDVIGLILNKLGKSFEDCIEKEKALITDACFDCSIGRYSKFLNMSKEEMDEFFKFCEEHEMDYFELSDAERWAAEDAFYMQL